MSLLEDVFLEDEAGEAQELERIIEGDEYDERRPSTPDSNENSEKEDEAEEDRRHVDASSAKTKRIVKNPRVILNPARLTGPRGIQVIPEHFKDFKFKGKGQEKEDLDLVLKKLEHWAYRLYPKFEFKDCLKKIETLGNKRPVMVHLTKIRTDQFTSDDVVVQHDSSEDEMAPEPIEDEFDKLLQQQIELARTTPAPGTAKKGFTTPTVEKFVTMPKASSSPSINDEQRERMIRNRQLAEERRLARLKLNNSGNRQENTISNTGINTELEEPTDKTLHIDSRDNNIFENGRNIEENESDTTIDNSKIVATVVSKKTKESINGKSLLQDAEENIARVKSNRSNVIDSSDSEDDRLILNESVTVDIHDHRNYDSDDGSDTLQETENEHRNTDVAYLNANDEKSNSGMKQQSEVKGSEIHNENQLNEQDKKIHSDTDHQTENAIENIRNDTNDVVMNEINSVNDSRSANNAELADHIKEKTTNKKNLKMLECKDNSAVSQISESVDNLRDAMNSSDQEAEQNKETAIADVGEIMDVDFSDDF